MDMVMKLRELRRMHGFTQDEVARRSGVGVKTISSFETGARTDCMKVTQLLALLSIYGMAPADFFGGSVERMVRDDQNRLLGDEERREWPT